jgi:DNA-binding NtrC family response regulator
LSLTQQIQEELTKAKSPAPGAFDMRAALGMPFHDAVASWERHLIEQALMASEGNKTDAARRLGIHRRLFYEKLTQFGMF